MSEDSKPTLWKVLGPDGESIHGGNLNWSLPTDDAPGEWHEVSGPIVPCQSGLHLTESPDDWWDFDCTLWVAEYEGEAVQDCGKVVVRKARLVRRATEEEYLRFESAYEDSIDPYDEDDDDWENDEDWDDDEDDGSDWDDDGDW